MTRSQVALGSSYILIALVRGPSQTHVLAWTVARTCGKGLHVLAWRDAMCCLTLPQTLALFASNACPLCLKRMPSLPQTLSSAPANVCLRFWLFLPRDDERYGLPLAPWISSLIGLFVRLGGKMSVTYRSQGGSAAPSRESFVVSKICINGKVAVTLYHIIYIRKNIYGYTATVSQCDGRVQKPVCQETA